MLLLRQIAAIGLTMLLLPLWRRAHPLALGGTSSPQDGTGGAAAEPAGAAAAAGAAELQLDPAAVAAAAEALRAAVLADAGGFAAGLFQQLSHGHPLLGAEGQQRSIRCGTPHFVQPFTEASRAVRTWYVGAGRR